MAGDSDVLSNADACLAKGSNLWFPETGLEMVFVAANFPSPNSTYQLGIDQVQKELSIAAEQINACIVFGKLKYKSSQLI